MTDKDKCHARAIDWLSTLVSHACRAADLDTAFLLSYIQPMDKILDVSCGRGRIPIRSSAYAAEGLATRVDISSCVFGAHVEARNARLRQPADFPPG